MTTRDVMVEGTKEDDADDELEVRMDEPTAERSAIAPAHLSGWAKTKPQWTAEEDAIIMQSAAVLEGSGRS